MLPMGSHLRTCSPWVKSVLTRGQLLITHGQPLILPVAWQRANCSLVMQQQTMGSVVSFHERCPAHRFWPCRAFSRQFSVSASRRRRERGAVAGPSTDIDRSTDHVTGDSDRPIAKTYRTRTERRCLVFPTPLSTFTREIRHATRCETLFHAAVRVFSAFHIVNLLYSSYVLCLGIFDNISSLCIILTLYSAPSLA